MGMPDNGLCFPMRAMDTSVDAKKVEAIHAYLNAINLELIANYNWKIIRQGLAASTGLRVDDEIWNQAIAAYANVFDKE
ncbi:MAG: hypothetical protein KDB27_26515 [Planctomycetales bacterium]|nr:hypothetical protein [Planctomycetales bacterium]